MLISGWLTDYLLLLSIVYDTKYSVTFVDEDFPRIFLICFGFSVCAFKSNAPLFATEIKVPLPHVMHSASHSYLPARNPGYLLFIESVKVHNVTNELHIVECLGSAQSKMMFIFRLIAHSYYSLDFKVKFKLTGELSCSQQTAKTRTNVTFLKSLPDVQTDAKKEDVSG